MFTSGRSFDGGSMSPTSPGSATSLDGALWSSYSSWGQASSSEAAGLQASLGAVPGCGLAQVVLDGRARLVVTGGLGSGGYACVVKAQLLLRADSGDENGGATDDNSSGLLATGKACALKVVGKAGLRRSKDRKRLALELRLLTELPPCPFLARCRAAFESARDVFFVMDLLEGGDLFFHLAQV